MNAGWKRARAPLPTLIGPHRWATPSYPHRASPMGSATIHLTPGCLICASFTSAGMSSCMCLPLERKYGAITTVSTPLAAHRPVDTGVGREMHVICGQ